MNLKLLLFLLGPTITGLIGCGGTEIDKPSNTVETIVRVETSAPSKPVEITKHKVLTPDEELLKRGRIVWFKCRSCHEVSVDGPHKVGPNLNGVFGATAGQKEGFNYSKVMVDSGIIWTDETMDSFIERPSAYLKGTKMAFVGIKKEGDRKALIRYLEETTK